MNPVTVPIKPVVSTTALTVSTTAQSKDITDPGATGTLFASVAVGQRVVGAGIPWGSKVTAKPDTNTVTIDKYATATSASVAIRFGYFTSAAYTDGDTFGFPFDIPLRRIENIMLIDKTDQLAALKLYVFRETFTEVADNAAWAPSDDAASKIIAYYSLTGTVDVGGAKIVFPAAAELPLVKCGAERMYGQLVVVGTPTMAAVDDIILNLQGT